jgi:hypothetical protein
MTKIKNKKNTKSQISKNKEEESTIFRGGERKEKKNPLKTNYSLVDDMCHTSRKKMQQRF